MDVTAICERSGDWWAITVPEVEGGYSQARRLDQVPAMVADLVNLATGIPARDVHVTVDARVPGDSLIEWERAARLQEESRRLQDEAAAQARVAVGRLRAEGLSVRDIGTLLQVSPQRVSQLTGR